MNARELLNKLVTEVASGMYDWDNLPVVVNDTWNDDEYVIDDIAIEGGYLRIEYKGPNTDHTEVD